MPRTKRNGHLAGGKFTASHTTVIDEAQQLAQRVEQLECVSKISLGIIQRLMNGQPRITFSEPGPGCVLAKIRGRSSIQELRIYTTDPEEVQSTMEAIFKG